MVRVAALEQKEGNMEQLPDPKVFVGAVVGGAIELAEGPVRALGNAAGAVDTYASHVKANMETLKRAPDDPSVIPSVALKGLSHTIVDGLAFFKGKLCHTKTRQNY
ncbi:hypothetical protein ES703_44611 [subsurface metagenome]